MQQGALPRFLSGQTQSLKPFLRLEINQFKHSAAEILNVRARLSKLVIYIDGLCIVRLSPLLIVLANILTQAKNVFFSKPTQIGDEIGGKEAGQSEQHSKHQASDLNPSKKVNVCFKEFQIDMFLERVPELVSTYTNDLAAKTFSMVFVEKFFIPIKFPEFNTATAAPIHIVEEDPDTTAIERGANSDSHQLTHTDGPGQGEKQVEVHSKSQKRHSTLADRIRQHYQSQIMSHASALLVNTKFLDGPTALYSSVNQKWLQFFKTPTGEGGKAAMAGLNSHHSKKAFRESIYTAFRAHNQAVGNHGMIAGQNDNKSWYSGSLSIDRALQMLYSIPFAGRWVPGKRLSEESGEASRQLLAQRKPHRIPRFFFKNAILIPYSSLKARLQMVVDNRDVIAGTFYFITPDDVILLAPERMYIVSRDPDKEVHILQIDQIFNVVFEEPQTSLKPASQMAEQDDMMSLSTLRQEGSAVLSLVIYHYDKKKFEKNVSRAADPFVKADKYLRLEFVGVNQKVRKEFEERIKLEKENNFVAFF